jgi:hypothetical protein
MHVGINLAVSNSEKLAMYELKLGLLVKISKYFS